MLGSACPLMHNIIIWINLEHRTLRLSFSREDNHEPILPYSI